ncbi:putative ran exchange factor prp20 pim1 [Venustampulla echinocandica]|uniref:Putative ran exchange factor prp20 pim1 n=1 Tax=Venustampulla echinocandica TaxID=2656787 RepID=A0A370U245_9HELO|nr:putative ran exchange factor prp20 pim1 [Venustampulla echinocandica]RDL41846.1 putative ran exchange factor prp20 pim1 [Venustampulla echinocandica]
MPPKKANTSAAKSAAKPAATRAKRAATPKPAILPNTKKPVAAKKSTVASKASKPAASKPAAKARSATPKPAAAPKAAKSTSTKRKASEEDVEEPKSKKAKTAVEPKKAAAKAAPKPPVKKARAKSVTKKAATEEPDEKPAKAAVKPAAAKPKKQLPTLNTPPTQRLDIYVFGENSAGELGLGARGSNGRKVTDVARPRLNDKLSAKDVGVVQIAVGGMHCAALTHDNKILTWGVNDQAALGRETSDEGKMVTLDAGEAENEDSDSDSDDDSGLNPSEAEPREVDPKYFPEGTKFVSVHAGDSATFALTTVGTVYGWGTFRGNDGILGFRTDVHIAHFPMLIPELKNITSMAIGSNHVLALNNKGRVFAWGAGEQNQLARRVVSRTATGALIPREFGLQRKTIVHIGTGAYHSFAVDNKGNVMAWGLNTFGQTGVPKDDDEDDTVATPTLVESLSDYSVQQITGGAHHSMACTKDGKALIWGRADGGQTGLDISSLPTETLYYDEYNKPRYLVKPTAIPNVNCSYVAAGSDTCVILGDDGKAYSWGFSTNYQTGLGTDEDVKTVQHVDNTAVREKKLVFAGVGGQFGVLAGVAA